MIWICFSFLFFSFVVIILGRNYEKQLFANLNAAEHPLSFLYSSCFFLLCKLKLLSYLLKPNVKLDKKLKNIYMGEELEQIKVYYICKKLSFSFIFIVLTFIIGCFLLMGKEQQGDVVDGSVLLRNTYGEGEKEIQLQAIIEEEETEVQLDLSYPLAEIRYNEIELKEKIEEIKVYLDNIILGDNESKDEIRYKVNLIKRIDGTSFKITWQLDENGLIERSGELNNKGIDKEGVLTKLIAYISYFDIKVSYEIYVRILPYIETKEERIRTALLSLIKEADEINKEESYMLLPKYYNEKNIKYVLEHNKYIYKIIIAGLLIAISSFFLYDFELVEKQKKREEQLLLDYGEFIEKVMLLLQAGSTVKACLFKLREEYEQRKKPNEIRYLYEEIIITCNELDNGVTQTKAYEAFGKRIRLLPYLKFVTLMVQNVQKGSERLLEQLQCEAVQAIEERRELIKRKGEEASTKLLVPMMIMLVVVLMLVMIPAFINLV